LSIHRSPDAAACSFPVLGEETAVAAFTKTLGDIPIEMSESHLSLVL